AGCREVHEYLFAPVDADAHELWGRGLRVMVIVRKRVFSNRPLVRVRARGPPRIRGAGRHVEAHAHLVYAEPGHARPGIAFGLQRAHRTVCEHRCRSIGSQLEPVLLLERTASSGWVAAVPSATAPKTPQQPCGEETTAEAELRVHRRVVLAATG